MHAASIRPTRHNAILGLKRFSVVRIISTGLVVDEVPDSTIMNSYTGHDPVNKTYVLKSFATCQPKSVK